MKENQKKYQRNNFLTNNKDKGQIKVNEKKSNVTIVESKYTKPYSKNVVEHKVEIKKEPSKDRFGNIPKTTGRFSAINSNKKENNVNNNVVPNAKFNEKDSSHNKVNTNYYSTKTTTNNSKTDYKWRVQEVKVEKEQTQFRKYGNGTEKGTSKEENTNYKPNNAYLSKYTKEQKFDKNPHVVSNTANKSIVVQNKRNKPEEKILKKEPSAVKIKNEPFKTNEIKNRNESSNLEKKYSFKRDRITTTKTEENLPQNKPKEEFKVENRRGKNIETSSNFFSRNFGI